MTIIMEEKVILVNKKDQEIGVEEKLKAHQDGKLHRAFSIFIFNSQGELLLQQRAKIKYHSGGLWTNTCCSHPRLKENLTSAAHRRLREEMGFDCPLREIFKFWYRGKLNHGLTEHEIDHVFIGKFNGQPKPNPDEVDQFRWLNPKLLNEDLKKDPQNYTYWFKKAINKVLSDV